MKPLHQQRVQVAKWALETLTNLGHHHLINTLWIKWRPRFTSRLGDARYIWVDKRPPRPYYFPGLVAMKDVFKRHPDEIISTQRFDCITRVRFSIPLWCYATERERYETVVHEIAHIVCMHECMLSRSKYPKPHGREWKAVMERAAVAPVRCHNVEKTEDNAKDNSKDNAKCGCKTYSLNHVRRFDILTGEYIPECKECGERITLL